jgi:hypothetical protein
MMTTATGQQEKVRPSESVEITVAWETSAAPGTDRLVCDVEVANNKPVV